MRTDLLSTAFILVSLCCNAGEPFIFDFAADGVPNEFFKVQNVEVKESKDGVEATFATTDKWIAGDIIPRFDIEGDFELEVEFDQLSIEGVEKGELAGVALVARFKDADQTHALVVRNQADDDNRLLLQTSKMLSNGKRNYPSVRHDAKRQAGRLKISRKDSTILFMAMEEGETEYKVLEEKLTDLPTEPDGLRLRHFGRGDTKTKILWKSIRIQADKLTYLPTFDENVKKILYVMNADGTDVREVTKPLWGMNHLGSPEWSNDGKRICFDMSMGGADSSHVVSIKPDGTDPKDHGLGCMPSFSPEAEYLVYTSPGIMRTDVDGTFHESLDKAGWGVQWSPDGRYIAYAKSGNIVLMDVDTDETRLLFNEEQAKQVGQIHQNLGWSHDSKTIAFKARNKESRKDEIVVADIDAVDGFQVLAEHGEPWIDFTFTPDNRKLLFPMRFEGSEHPQLVMVSRDNPGIVEEYPNLPKGFAFYEADFSPDGKQIVFSGLKLPVPVIWGE